MNVHVASKTAPIFRIVERNSMKNIKIFLDLFNLESNYFVNQNINLYVTVPPRLCTEYMSGMDQLRI